MRPDEIDPFSEKLSYLLELHNRKQSDYGHDDDPYANVRQSSAFGVHPWVGAMIRLNDKVKRTQSFAQRGELKNESLEDSFKDIAVYAIIAWILYEEENKAVRLTRPTDDTNNSVIQSDPSLVISY